MAVEYFVMDGVYKEIMILLHNQHGNEMKGMPKYWKIKTRACVHLSLSLYFFISFSPIWLICVVKSCVYSTRSNVLILCINSTWCAVWTNLLIYDRNRHNLAIINFDHALIYVNFHIVHFCSRSYPYIYFTFHSKTFKYNEQVFNELINSLHFVFEIDEKSGNTSIWCGSLMWQRYT